MNYYYPTSLKELREGIERSIERGATALKIGELMDKHGSDEWLGPLMDELGPLRTSQPYHDKFIDIGRIKLNRKKQKEGVYTLKSLCNYNSYDKLKSIFAGAAISGLFAIFHDGTDYFRIKNIPDNAESREILRGLGLEVYDSVDSIKSSARSSLASSDKRSNVV